MREQDLIGIWSEGRRHGPGAMSDVCLAFLSDGRGFLEYANPVSAYVEAFRWSGGEERDGDDLRHGQLRGGIRGG